MEVNEPLAFEDANGTYTYIDGQNRLGFVFSFFVCL